MFVVPTRGSYTGDINLFPDIQTILMISLSFETEFIITIILTFVNYYRNQECLTKITIIYMQIQFQP